MWPYPKIVAHRGGGTLAPENTIAGLRCGLAYGFRAVEFDVMLARDGIGVVMHDPEFGRTVAGPGSVAATDAAVLSGMDAGAWFDARFAGEPVPYFTQFVDYCREQKIWMNIEIKPVPGYETATGRWVALATAAAFAAELEVQALASAAGVPIGSQHPRQRAGVRPDGSDPGGTPWVLTDAAGTFDPATLPLLASFSVEALAAAREAVPALPRAWLVDRIPADWEAQARALGAVAIHTNHKHLTPEQAKAIKTAGFGLFCYTVNDPERAREITAWGVDSFCTDRIDLIGPAFA